LALQQELDAVCAQAAQFSVAEGADNAIRPDLAVWSRTGVAAPAQRVMCRAMPSDPATAAQQLFATLRELDAHGVREIWVEAPPISPDWDGVRDRLQRAAHQG